MTETPPDGRATWPYEPLYKFIREVLPEFHSDSGILDVPALSDALSLSEESVYKWFRKRRLPARRAPELFKLSQSDSNISLLVERGIAPPSLVRFYEFSS